MLMEVKYSSYIQIQELHTGNNRGVNENYRVLGCETTQLANVLEHAVPPSSRSQGASLLVGSLLQPQMGRFITRYSSSSIDANNLLLTNRTTCFQTVTYKTILCIMMPSYTANRANLPWEEGCYSSWSCSCMVTYGFRYSSQTLLNTCHHTVQIPYIWRHNFSEYPNHLLHHVNSDQFYLSAHYTCIIPSSQQNFLIV